MSVMLNGVFAWSVPFKRNFDKWRDSTMHKYSVISDSLEHYSYLGIVVHSCQMAPSPYQIQLPGYVIATFMLMLWCLHIRWPLIWWNRHCVCRIPHPLVISFSCSGHPHASSPCTNAPPSTTTSYFHARSRYINVISVDLTRKTDALSSRHS